MAVHLPPGRAALLVEPTNGHTFTLTELQTLVGGYIEVVPLRPGPGRPGRTYLVLNEDGKRLNLPYNSAATYLLEYQAVVVPLGDVVVGDAVVCTHRELEGGPE